MLDAKIITIIDEELDFAKNRIAERIECFLTERDGDGWTDLSPCCGPADRPKPPFPNAEKYQVALDIYQEGKNHSRVARELGVTINAAKKYYTWLVRNGYLEPEEAELSDTEKKVIHCIFDKGMSLTATAKELHCSVTNVVTRRNSAISKGYIPPAQETGDEMG